MGTILNFCFCDYAKRNIAENFTQPTDYFFAGRKVVKVPMTTLPADVIGDNVSMIIIGGGGIFTDCAHNIWGVIKTIVSYAPKAIPIVIWGMGINDHRRYDQIYNDTLDWLLKLPNVLVGLRDNCFSEYVPCVSCMRPELNMRLPIENEAVYYAHHGCQLELSLPTMSNQIQGCAIEYLKRVLEFMAAAEIVVTNTYHGAYWATLLNKKVIVINPFSNKFFSFKHEPIITDVAANLRHIFGLARCYPAALAECRAANLNFYNHVLSFMSQHGVQLSKDCDRT